MFMDRQMQFAASQNEPPYEGLAMTFPDSLLLTLMRELRVN